MQFGGVVSDPRSPPLNSLNQIYACILKHLKMPVYMNLFDCLSFIRVYGILLLLYKKNPKKKLGRVSIEPGAPDRETE